MGRYRRVKEGGITFLFKYDEVDPTLLHIFARHLMEVDDALDLFLIPMRVGTNSLRGMKIIPKHMDCFGSGVTKRRKQL